MSEYQYYAFQSQDQPLSREQMDELRQYSSRAQITPSSFVNIYNYGDFRGDPKKLIENYFDAFLYLANWGTRWLMFRVPEKLLSLETAENFKAGDCFSCWRYEDQVVLSFRSEDEEDDTWAEGDGWLSSLLPIRTALMHGDQRALYLGWLLAVQAGELDEDALEPAVPPGLSELDASLDQLVQFLRIDRDLINAAAEQSETKASTLLSKNDITAWLLTLSAKKKDAVLASLIVEDKPHLISELKNQALNEVYGTSPQADGPRRTVAELLEHA